MSKTRKQGQPAAAGPRAVARNKQAWRNYDILERFEAGIVLTGSEIKSIRDGRITLAESYVRIDGEEATLVGANIAAYHAASYLNHEPTRPRRLLLHKKEISKLIGRVQLRGLTMVPLSVYFRRGWAKVEVAVVRGKAKRDHREDLKKRDAQREMQRAFAGKHR